MPPNAVITQSTRDPSSPKVQEENSWPSLQQWNQRDKETTTAQTSEGMVIGERIYGTRVGKSWLRWSSRGCDVHLGNL
ncbi:unnamed protein product, partial [Nezara viridula]